MQFWLCCFHSVFWSNFFTQVYSIWGEDPLHSRARDKSDSSTVEKKEAVWKRGKGKFILLLDLLLFMCPWREMLSLCWGQGGGRVVTRAQTVMKHRLVGRRECGNIHGSIGATQRQPPCIGIPARMQTWVLSHCKWASSPLPDGPVFP